MILVVYKVSGLPLTLYTTRINIIKPSEGSMADLKTKMNAKSVETFLNGLEDETKRQDLFAIVELMKQVAGIDPVMWGESIIGFGNYHYVYETGREGDTFLVGFSPRKQNLTVYLTYGFEQDEDFNETAGQA